MDLATGGQWWRFYCYLCDQWAEREGPWCELYRAETDRTDVCIFVENPGWKDGVAWSLDPESRRTRRLVWPWSPPSPQQGIHEPGEGGQAAGRDDQ